MRRSIFGLLLVAALIATGCTRSDELKRDHKELGDQVTTQPARGNTGGGMQSR